MALWPLTPSPGAPRVLARVLRGHTLTLALYCSGSADAAEGPVDSRPRWDELVAALLHGFKPLSSTGGGAGSPQLRGRGKAATGELREHG